MGFVVVKIFNRMFRPSPRATQLIVTGIDCDLSQPSPERRLVRAVISIEREVSFGEAVLNDLFDLFALREKAAPDARYLTAVTFEQLLESHFVARAGSGDQRVICPLCEWKHKLLPSLSHNGNAVRSHQASGDRGFFQLMRYRAVSARPKLTTSKPAITIGQI